jgi:hypothetical protein
MQNWHQSTWNHDTLYVIDLQRTNKFNKTTAVKNGGGLFKVQIRILFYGGNSLTVALIQMTFRVVKLLDVSISLI